MAFNDYLYQYTPGNLQAANLGWQADQKKGNPLADIIKTLVGAGVGFMTGGPTGAALGAAQGMGQSTNPDVAGIAQAGLGGYQAGTQMGLKDQFAKALQGSSMDADTKNILAIASQDPALGKEIFGQYAKSKMQAYDPMTMLLLKSMGFDPSALNKTQTTQVAEEGSIVEGPDGKRYKIQSGKLIPI